MSLKIESARLSEISSKIAELKKLEKIDQRISLVAGAESVGILILIGLQIKDPQLLPFLAESGALAAGMTALFAGIIRQNNMAELRGEALELKCSQQDEKLDQLVGDLPEDDFSGIWNNLQQFREAATLEADEFADEQDPTVESLYQAFARRAGESPQQPD